MFPLSTTIQKYLNIDFLPIKHVLCIQNIALFGISMYSLYSFINYYQITGTKQNIVFYNLDWCIDNMENYDIFMEPFEKLWGFLKIYVIVDLLFTQSADAFLHHICVLGIYCYELNYNVNKCHNFLFKYTLIKTEISSIFLVLKYWLPKKSYAYGANILLFYVSFLKFRIYDVYTELFYNHNPFEIIVNTYSYSNPLINGLFYMSIYGLCILNIYWFSIMTKMFYKKLFG